MKSVRYLHTLVLIVLMLPVAASALPPELEGLGLREHKVAARDMPGWEKPDKVVVRNLFGEDAIPALRKPRRRRTGSPRRSFRSPPWKPRGRPCRGRRC